MADYTYTRVTGGYRWNALRRITESVGIEPVQMSDQSIDGAIQTVITFSRDLTPAEKTALDTVMANNPTQPPTPSGTRFKITDIYNKLNEFNATTGITWRIYFSESVPGSGNVDTIELQANTVLSNAQKNTTKNAFAALIREG